MGRSDVGPSSEAPAAEMVESGFALEIADAPLLHDGLNMADLAHLLVLAEQGVVPPAPAARVIGAVLDVVRSIPAEDFPYDPAYGDAYNSREAYFVRQV
ncbi:MAG: argininosuccinate lyase, partial [Actinomycetota bacterium]|nr:argininosuccinate lyase [Actinomycetota bacterium]